MSLLQMSISGAVMILVVIVIRALAINRLPKKTFIALWGIVLLRILVPFSFPSPFSAYSLVNYHVIAPQETYLVNANIFSDHTATSPIITNIIQEQTATNLSTFVLIWVVGMIACALFFTASYIKCRREFRESLPIKNDFSTKWIAEHKLTRPIEIRQSSRISAPLTYGVFKPIILMPKNTDWDNVKQINYILTHEFVHIKRFDAATKLFLTAAICIHWFNPLVWAMYVLANRDIELFCDEMVISSFGETTKTAYALTLINIEEKKNTLTPLCNNFSKNAIEERITAIMKMKKTSLVAVLVAFLLVGSVTMVFATSAAEKSQDDTRIANSTDTLASSQKQVTNLGNPAENGETIIEINNDHVEDSLNDYSDFGISYDKNNKHWIYNNRPIHFLSDGTKITYLDNSISATENGVSLQVIRNTDGEIDKLGELTQNQVDALLNNTQNKAQFYFYRF